MSKSAFMRVQRESLQALNKIQAKHMGDRSKYQALLQEEKGDQATHKDPWRKPFPSQIQQVTDDQRCALPKESHNVPTINVQQTNQVHGY